MVTQSGDRSVTSQGVREMTCGQPAAPEPEGQIRVRVKAAGVGPTDLALRSGRLKAFSLQQNAVLGFEVAGTVDAVGPE